MKSEVVQPKIWDHYFSIIVCSHSSDPRKLHVGVTYYIVHMYSMLYYTYGSTANFLFLGPKALIYIYIKNALRN